MTAGYLNWLAKQQSRDGSFMGEASPTIKPFLPDRRHQTVFFTSLILGCLESIDDGESIARQGARFLRRQQSPIASWNYWRRGCRLAASYPYPDDLDDTACALLALTTHDPRLVDGSMLASVAKLLIANETSLGGPYRTWLVQPDLYSKWGDIDIAVNANIGGLLARHGVRAPGLMSFINQRLIDSNLDSPYYVSDIPTLYFLARWYRDTELARLRQLISDRLQRPDGANALTTALLLSAGCDSQLPLDQLREAQQQLRDLSEADHWPAEALYVDPIIKGVQYFAGSAALTTAFALEALAKFNHYAKPRPPKAARQVPPLNTVVQALTNTQRLSPGLREAYRRLIIIIGKHDSRREITGIASLTAAAYGKPVRPQILEHLNLASLHGWIAYTIYDDFFDDEGSPALLSLANYALRQTSRHYYMALPQQPAFAQLVDKTLDTIDAANRWEVLHARGQLDGPHLSYKLPDYGQHHQLAERSWGHMLSSTGILLALGYKLDSFETRQLHRFFRHFLIARQLNDDAHDWETDLQRGQLSAVVCLLLADYSLAVPVNIQAERHTLRQHFWHVTISQINTLINAHTRRARQALAQLDMQDNSVFAAWLQTVEMATSRAVEDSQEVQKFIDTYRQPSKSFNDTKR